METRTASCYCVFVLDAIINETKKFLIYKLEEMVSCCTVVELEIPGHLVVGKISNLCRQSLKSHDFTVRLTVFSSVSRSDDETQKCHDKQSHKLKRYNFLL